MAVTDFDLSLHLSGGAENADPNASLGGAVSNAVLASFRDGNLFDDVDQDEALAGDTEYRCIYLVNSHPTDTLFDARAWLHLVRVPAGTSLTLGADPVGPGQEAAPLADEGSEPAGVVFQEAYAAKQAVALGDLGPGQAVGMWIRRTVQPYAWKDHALFIVQASGRTR